MRARKAGSSAFLARRRLGRGRGLAAILAASLLVAAAARGEPPSEPRASGTAPSGGSDLDRLLKLPSTLDYGYEKRGGATRAEWRARFDEARASLASAEEALAKAQDELAHTVGQSDAWNVAPPGLPAEATTEGGTDSFRLRQEVRRQRSEIARAQRRLRELEVEANLVGVPEDWRGTPGAVPRTGASPGDESVLRGGSPP